MPSKAERSAPLTASCCWSSGVMRSGKRCKSTAHWHTLTGQQVMLAIHIYNNALHMMLECGCASASRLHVQARMLACVHAQHAWVLEQILPAYLTPWTLPACTVGAQAIPPSPAQRA